MRTLRKITVKGFKSIRDQTLELDRLNVLSGGNSPWMPFSFAPQQ
jgi:predicted ATPase